MFCDALNPTDFPFHQGNFLIWWKTAYFLLAVEQRLIHILLIVVGSLPRLLGAVSNDLAFSIFGRKLFFFFDIVPFSVIGKEYI